MDLKTKKSVVIEAIRTIIESGKLISEETKEPLNKQEQQKYFVRAFFYLNKEDVKWRKVEGKDECLAPTYDNIFLLLELPKYSEYLETVVETMCKLPVDEDEYKKWLDEQQEKRMPSGKVPPKKGFHSKNLPKMGVRTACNHVVDNAVGIIAAGGGLAAFGRSFVSQAADDVFRTFIGQFQCNLISAINGTAISAGCYLAGVGTYNVVQSLRGKQSWKRTGKNLLEEAVATGSGIAAGIAVSALLALTPVTGGISLLVGIAAGIGIGVVARVLIKKKSSEWFGIPEDETLERAYNLLDAKQGWADDEIRRAYRKKSLELHPDKYYVKNLNATKGDKAANLKKYLKMQAAYGMIVAFRGENDDDYKEAKESFTVLETKEDLEEGGLSTIYLRIKMSGIAKKIVELGMGWTKGKIKKLPAITNGILPVRFFEDDEDDQEEEDEVGVNVTSAKDSDDSKTGMKDSVSDLNSDSEAFLLECLLAV